MSEKTIFKANPYNLSNKLLNVDNINDIMKLVNITDFKIKNLELYQRAFVHKSYCNMKQYEEFNNDISALPLFQESYEKIEFLGDSILGYIVCEYIYNRYTIIYNKDEGFLTKLKNRLVCGNMLCELAKNLSFNKYLILSKHIDENCDGRNNKNILEDSFEAFLGALYLDTNDIHFVKDFCIKVFEKFVDFGEIILNDNNFKDILQRYMNNTFETKPIYKTIKLDDENMYHCKVYKIIDDVEEFITEGIENTIKKAEQLAAKNTLLHYGVLN